MTVGPIVLLACILLLAAYGAGIFSWTVFVSALALSLCVQPWAGRWRRENLSRSSLRRLLASPLALLLIYLLLILLPMSSGMSAMSGHERAQQNRRVAETLEMASMSSHETGITPFFSVTRSRAGSLRFLLLLIPVMAGWRIIASTPVNPRERWLRLLLVIAALMGTAGILSRGVYPQGDTLWWIIPIPHGLPGPMGGFMNRNHFAGFCAILAPAAAALSIQDFHRRRFLLALFNLTITTLLSLGVLFSLSRGGMVALAAGMMTLLLIGLRLGNTTTRVLTVLAAMLLTVSAATVVQRNRVVLDRVLSLRNPSSESSLQDRFDAWRDSVRIWRQYPLLGAGPNAFRSVYPQHRTSSARETRDFAENEYMQWIAETGVAGILIFFLFSTKLLLRAWRMLRTDPRGHLALPAAATAALAAAAVHALVDFPMHLPLYAITLAAMTGMLWPAPDNACSSPDETPSTQATPVRGAWIGWIGILCVPILSFADIRLDTAGRLSSANLHDTVRALTSTPTSPIAWRRFSTLFWQMNTPSSQTLAEQCLTQAALYDPNNYPLWHRLGDVRSALGDNHGALDAYHRVNALRPWVNVPTRLPEGP